MTMLPNPDDVEPVEALDAGVEAFDDGVMDTIPEPTSLVAESESIVPESEPELPAAPPKHWYVIKVQSGREESIKTAIERRVRIEGLEEFFAQIVIPTEKVTVLKKVTERKNGEKVTKEKRVIKETKKFPGYLMAEVEFNDRILYLFRETSGVGDFVGATLTRAPIPMTDREVQSMLADQGAVGDAEVKVAPVVLKFGPGDKVKVRDGTFSGMEGEVKRIIDPTDPKDSPRVAVEITIWGRPVSMDLEHWQVELV